MAKQRNYSTEFKRQVVMEYLTGETLYGLSKRHDVSWNVIRLWIARYETDGELNDDTTAGDLLQDYKARIAALERLARKLAVILHRMWRDGAGFIWTSKEAAAAENNAQEFRQGG